MTYHTSNSTLELRTSAEWLPILYPGYEIMDPDGWRSANAPDFNEDPISEAEFHSRFAQSTIRPPSRR
jgi:hypothetical protein